MNITLWDSFTMRIRGYSRPRLGISWHVMFTCPCLGSQGWRAAGQSERQGRGAPAQVHLLIITHNWSRIKADGQVPQLTWRVFYFFNFKIFNSTRFGVREPKKSKAHHLCHILVDQDDVNVIPANEAFEGVLWRNWNGDISDYMLQEIRSHCPPLCQKWQCSCPPPWSLAS